jgi:hypothetical protein
VTVQRLRHDLCKFLRLLLDSDNYEPRREGAFKYRLGVLERDSRAHPY